MKKRTNQKLHIPYSFLWCITIILLTIIEMLLLIAISQIPRSAIENNARESAQYFMQRDVFYNISESDAASRIDHYADAILINILYNYDNTAPLSSTLKAAYYHSDSYNENDNLLTAVSDNVAPTYEYSRYWHGSAILIKPLLTIFNIKQIYILFALLLIVLTIVVSISLYRNGHKACMISFLIALIAISPWYIPMSLEYIWCFLIMLISVLIMMYLYNQYNMISPLFFLIIGNVTAYFDFLTTETITLLAPLSILLIIMYENNKLTNFKEGIKVIISHSLAWGIGYISSWIIKWTISSVVLHKDVFSEALSSASSRIYGNADNLTGIKLSVHALIRNISCILPFNFIPKYSYVYAILSFLVILMIYYLFRKNKNKNFITGLFAIIYCIPYIRYITLANHSYIHYFFTYRAQFASVFCLCIIFYYGIDRRLVSKVLPFISGSHNPSR